MSLASNVDDRTVRQQLEDLNVEVIDIGKPKITGVSWVKRASMAGRVGRKPQNPAINFAHYGLNLNIRATALLDVENKKYSIGVADFQQGKMTAKVLLLREDEEGYRFTLHKKRRSGSSQAPGLLRALLEAGLKHGRYELVKANDGWMGVPDK